MIGRIQRVPLREVWKHEALDFTTWLEKNIDVLNDALSISLSSAKREQAAGNFSVDLIAEDESGSFVVIENQLGKSDHDHLGKLLTYLVAFEAKTAIWIVSEPRAEHVSTIAWLNESLPASFYLLKVEAVKIGDSLPAPFLTPVVSPSEEGRRVGDAKKEQTEVHSVRQRFWTRLLEKAAQRTSIHAHASPSDRYYSVVGTGFPGLSYSYALVRGAARIELYIHQSGGAEENERVFDLLADRKQDIEAEYGEALHWQRNEGSNPCRIYKLIDVPDWADEEGWNQLHEEMIDSMIRLDRAIRPRLKELLA